MPDLTPAGLRPLQERCGYHFQEFARLKAALVHTSYVNERPDRALESNERLEFLGDAVLGVAVAHRLYTQRPASGEGDLTVLRAWLVRQSTLAKWAREVRLGDVLLLGRGEARGGGRERPAILARAFEALIGAVYLDGSLEAVRQVLDPFLDRELGTGFSPQKVVDAKSRLQQVIQARFDCMPEYTLLALSGPGHAPRFEVEVRAGPDIVARGAGRSKRTAQQAAAHEALKLLDVTEGYETPEDEEDDEPAR